MHNHPACLKILQFKSKLTLLIALKGTVHTKMKMLSFSHPQVVATQYEIVSHAGSEQLEGK